MTHRQIKHEQYFPLTFTDTMTSVMDKAEVFLKESAKEHPDWEYVVSFQKGGILVTGSIVE